jgi:hypothetical protein
MEHIHGTTLAERISKRSQSDTIWLRSLSKEIRGLLMKRSDYAHVLHGDRKTRNIIVKDQTCGPPRLRLIDSSHSGFCDQQQACWCAEGSGNRRLYSCTEKCECGKRCRCKTLRTRSESASRCNISSLKSHCAGSSAYLYHASDPLYELGVVF